MESAKTIDIKSLLSDLKPILIERFAVERIGYFGSYSKESASKESDIDILVELSHPIGWDFFALEEFLEKQTGKKIDLVTKNGLRPELRESILADVEYV